MNLSLRLFVNSSESVLNNENTKLTKDQALKNMSKYLLAGAEMLRESCPDCNVPLLKNKKNGKIFCGSCKRKAIISEKGKNKNALESSENQKILNSAEIILFGKLEQIANQIASKKVNDLKNDLELMNFILKMIRKISVLNEDLS